MATAPPWSFDLRPETRRVLAHGLASRATGPSGPLDDANWSNLRRQAAEHRLDGLLVAAVASGELATTVEQSRQAAELEIDLTLARMWGENRLVEVVGSLERVGVEVQVLKGLALAALDYPDPQWRPTGDLDLLVHGEQIDQAVGVLRDAGAVRLDPDPTPGYAATIGKGATLALVDGLEVDLHRVLVWGAFGVRICADDLWIDSRTFDIGGVPHRTLTSEASLLHACYHLVIRGWRRALTLRDVAQILYAPDLDIDRVLWLARRWRGEAVLAGGVLLACRELDLDSPSVLRDWAEGFAPQLRDRLWLRVERPGARVGVLEAAGTYVALRSRADRATLRRATFHPAPGTWPHPRHRVNRVARAAANRLRPGGP